MFDLFVGAVAGSAWLHLTNNDVRRSLPASVFPGGGVDPPRSLVVLGDGDQRGDCIVEGTRLRSAAGTEPLATIIDVAHCSVSANIIINEAEGRSLYLIPGGPTTDPPTGTKAPAAGDNICVTGNTFQGLVTLPPRSLNPPLDTWHVFNAET
jgi:hypothetical protein